jgi:hypothetical protein
MGRKTAAMKIIVSAPLSIQRAVVACAFALAVVPMMIAQESQEEAKPFHDVLPPGGTVREALAAQRSLVAALARESATPEKRRK